VGKTLKLSLRLDPEYRTATEVLNLNGQE
jgi:hypothetical protein